MNINKKSTFKCQSWMKANSIIYGKYTQSSTRLLFSLTLVSEYVMKTRDWRECFASVPIGRFEEPSLGIVYPATKTPDDL